MLFPRPAVFRQIWSSPVYSFPMQRFRFLHLAPLLCLRGTIHSSTDRHLLYPHTAISARLLHFRVRVLCHLFAFCIQIYIYILLPK
jgi:hypothetical protein